MREKRLLEIFLFVSILAVKIGLSSSQVILSGLRNQEFDRGSTAYFTVRVSNSVVEDGVWRKNGTELATIPNMIDIIDSPGVRQLVIYSLQTSDEGLYNFTILGESTSASLSITEAPGTWLPWGTWNNGSCSATCETNATYNRTRTRVCIPRGDKGCEGSSAETLGPFECGKQDCPRDGNWSAWTIWSKVICSVTCGSGQGPRIRYRYCNNPSPSNGGDHCEGNSSESEQALCANVSCPVWSEWNQQGVAGGCSVSCGSGTRTRTYGRTCLNGLSSSDCGFQRTKTETENCNERACPEWSEWNQSGVAGGCSVSCGGGTRTRTYNRTCLNGLSPSDCGFQRTKTETEICNERACPVWSVWNQPGVAGGCSVSCGSGTQTRTYSRTCLNGLSLSDCGFQRTKTETENCNERACPVWSEWNQSGVAGGCSVSCGSGTRTRTYSRTCLNGLSPSDCGSQSTKTETENCSEQACTGVVWSKWSPWSTSSCPVSCGEGEITRSRNRTCQGGSSCPGNAQESDMQKCSLQDCGVFAEKLEDTVAGPGSVHVFTVRTVESDIQGTWYKNNNTHLSETDRVDIETEGNVHRLTIRDVQLSDSGNYTFAVNGETTTAYLTVSDEIWGVWSAWSTSSCSVTCGKGEITSSRNRTCQGGGSCPGNATESDMQECSLKNCGVTAPVKSTNDEINWLIAAIGAVIVIGIALLILIIVCFICQCREKKPKAPTSVGTASWDLDERNEYLTRAKYNDPKLNGSEYTSTMIQ